MDLLVDLGAYSRGGAGLFPSLVLATPLGLRVVYMHGAGLISQGARRQWLISFLVHEQIANNGYSLVSADGVAFELAIWR